MKRVNNIFQWVALVAITLLFWGCGDHATHSLEDYKIETYSPHYATGFKILEAEDSHSSIIEIQNPWQGANDMTTSLFISRQGEVAPHGFKGEVLKQRAERIVCMSSTQIAMLDAVGCVRSVVGVSGIDYISNDYITSHRDSITDVGYEGSVEYELILSLNPDIVLIYSISGASAMEPKLRELGIPFVYIGEYLESSPLGKAEWMVAVAEIVNRREQGEAIFAEIPSRYNALKESLKDVTTKPKIMINTPYGDSWVMAPRGSYVAQLIADAGGHYIYAGNNPTTRPKSIDIEEAYLMASNSDVWINLGALQSLKEFKAQLPKFADIPCVVSGDIYNSNKRVNAYGGNDYFESGVIHPDVVLRDLITILHPELGLSQDSLCYYHKLK